MTETTIDKNTMQNARKPADNVVTHHVRMVRWIDSVRWLLLKPLYIVQSRFVQLPTCRPDRTTAEFIMRMVF